MAVVSVARTFPYRGDSWRAPMRVRKKLPFPLAAQKAFQIMFEESPTAVYAGTPHWRKKMMKGVIGGPVLA
jgi:hypothetical protein